MVIEMPVLDNALLGCALAFTPLMVALTVGEPVMRRVSAVRAAGPDGCRGRPTSSSTPCARTRAERGGAPGPVLRAHRAAPLRAPHVRDAGARDRPPARHRAPVLRRRDAGLRAAQRPARAGELDPRAAARARAADPRDRGVPGRVLAAADRQADAKAPSAPRAASGPSRSGGRRPSARRAWRPRSPSSAPATASATQWRTWPSSTFTATCSSAVWTAATWVRMSTQ